MKIKKIAQWRYILIMSAIISCHKKELLQQVPGNRFNILSTLEECQQLLDKDIKLNTTPVLGEVSADSYCLTEEVWQGLVSKEKNASVWSPDIFGEQPNDDDWNVPYEQVYYANLVLDALNSITVENNEQEQYNSIKGAAHFIRAYAFYNAAQLFARPFVKDSASRDAGIPLRLNPNVEEVSRRASVQQTYDQIINDLKLARSLLPLPFDKTYRNHPSGLAAMAMLARVYLSMGIYDRASTYADSCLMSYNNLIDYNSIDELSATPFERTNQEVIYQTRFHAKTEMFSGVTTARCYIDTTLYQLFDPADLRRTIFFTLESDKKAYRKKTYAASFLPFSGLATDEIYLIRAECRARLNNITACLDDLNHLAQNRYRHGAFVPFKATTGNEALQLVLLERKRELSFRGLRWTDIRRLNAEGTGIVLKRKINGRMYELPPRDKKYVLPIPSDVINKSGMEQNPR